MADAMKVGLNEVEEGWSYAQALQAHHVLDVMDAVAERAMAEQRARLAARRG